MEATIADCHGERENLMLNKALQGVFPHEPK